MNPFFFLSFRSFSDQWSKNLKFVNSLLLLYSDIQKSKANIIKCIFRSFNKLFKFLQRKFKFSALFFVPFWGMALLTCKLIIQTLSKSIDLYSTYVLESAQVKDWFGPFLKIFIILA